VDPQDVKYDVIGQ